MKGYPALVIALIVTMLLFGCSEVEESVEPVVVDEITFTLRSDSCEYDGPTVIRQGEVKLIYDKPSGRIGDVEILKIPEGKTWQETVDQISKKDKDNYMPEWAWDNLVSKDLVIDDPSATLYDLTPGLYAVICGEILDTGAFRNLPGTSFEVR